MTDHADNGLSEEEAYEDSEARAETQGRGSAGLASRRRTAEPESRAAAGRRNSTVANSGDASAGVLRTTDALAAVCRSLASEGFVCVDTEFNCEGTYWPRLCLVQLGAPSGRPEDAALVDTLSAKLHLEPLFDLLDDPGVVKVLHGGEQDLEIFSQVGAGMPRSVFDTQIAASFCGYGYRPSYAALAGWVTGCNVDKGLQVTDWARRPLNPRQLEYALGDVLHLPEIYRSLQGSIEEGGRSEWVREEMESAFADLGMRRRPDRAWRRLRGRPGRSRNRRYLGILREVAAWREREACKRDVPLRRVMGDDGVVEIARLGPRDAEEMGLLRLVQRQGRVRQHGDAILEAVRRGAECPEHELPDPDPVADVPTGSLALAALLKVFLKALASKEEIAEELVAGARDIERLAVDPEADLPVLRGWRRKLFGEELLRLCRGELALSAEDGLVKPLRVVRKRRNGRAS